MITKEPKEVVRVLRIIKCKELHVERCPNLPKMQQVFTQPRPIPVVHRSDRIVATDSKRPIPDVEESLTAIDQKHTRRVVSDSAVIVSFFIDLSPAHTNVGRRAKLRTPVAGSSKAS